MAIHFSDELINTPSFVWGLSENYLAPIGNLFNGKTYELEYYKLGMFYYKPAHANSRAFSKALIVASYASIVIFPTIASLMIAGVTTPLIAAAIVLGVAPIITAIMIRSLFRAIYKLYPKPQSPNQPQTSFKVAYESPKTQNSQIGHLESPFSPFNSTASTPLERYTENSYTSPAEKPELEKNLSNPPRNVPSYNEHSHHTKPIYISQLNLAEPSSPPTKSISFNVYNARTNPAPHVFPTQAVLGTNQSRVTEIKKIYNKNIIEPTPLSRQINNKIPEEKKPIKIPKEIKPIQISEKKASVNIIDNYEHIIKELGDKVDTDRNFEEILNCPLNYTTFTVKGNTRPVFLIEDSGITISELQASEWKAKLPNKIEKAQESQKQNPGKPAPSVAISLFDNEIKDFNYVENYGHTQQIRYDTATKEVFWIEPIFGKKLGEEGFLRPVFCKDDGVTYDEESLAKFLRYQIEAAKARGETEFLIESPARPEIWIDIKNIELYPNMSLYKYAKITNSDIQIPKEYGKVDLKLE